MPDKELEHGLEQTSVKVEEKIIERAKAYAEEHCGWGQSREQAARAYIAGAFETRARETRGDAWQALPAETRRELTGLCRSHTISHNTRLALERIFDKNNINPKHKSDKPDNKR